MVVFKATLFQNKSCFSSECQSTRPLILKCIVWWGRFSFL